MKQFLNLPNGRFRASNRAAGLTEVGERRLVEPVRWTAVYFLATLHLARLLGASRETKRVCSKRQHGGRWPLGSGESGSRRFAGE
jgi:hypothetical protein